MLQGSEVPQFDLTGRVAIVTGGSQGLGKAMALALAEAGADIAIVSRRPEAVSGRGANRPHEPAAPAVEAVKALGRRCIAIDADVRAPEQVERLVQEVLDEYGRIDALVNNAGGSWGETFQTGLLLEVTPQDFDETFRLNVKNPLLCSRAVAPVMKEQGKGAIINIASVHATMTTYNFFPYNVAKSGILGLTRSIALDWGHKNIRAVAVSPGWVRTKPVLDHFAQADDPAAEEDRVKAIHPLKRIGEPENIGALVAFLASHEASFITGTEIIIDGGISARHAD